MFDFSTSTGASNWFGSTQSKDVEESESVVSLQVVLVRELLAILNPSNLQIIFSKIVHFIVC